MRILDKTISKPAWEQLTAEQCDQLTQGDNLLPWMFQQSVVLTVVDKDDNVQQLNGIEPVTPNKSDEPFPEPIEPEVKLTLRERFRAWFIKDEETND